MAALATTSSAAAAVPTCSAGPWLTVAAPALPPTTRWPTSTGPGGDTLNLADLLIGESAGNLDNYLHFSSVGGSTVVQISATGGFAAGFNASAIDQTITLQNVDLGAATQNTQQVIDQLLSNGNLTVNG